jgi:hypothetical protein
VKPQGPSSGPCPPVRIVSSCRRNRIHSAVLPLPKYEPTLEDGLHVENELVPIVIAAQGAFVAAVGLKPEAARVYCLVRKK